MKKEILSFFLVLILLCALGLSSMATAEDSGFSDVPSGTWYAEAVNYVWDNGLMSGTTKTTFAPETTTSRAMLVTILHRRAGSPAAQPANFSDVVSNAWYGSAAGWAAANGIVSGYSDGRFAPNDPVTREQLATILWRVEGSPAPTTVADFVDRNAIASFATNAVAWALEEGIVSGKDAHRFEPQGSATRAELAAMLHRWLRPATPSERPDTNTLVAYFSCTGSTKAIAETLSEHLGADLYAITPAQSYTASDLNYSDSSSRSSREQRDPDARPALGGSTLDLTAYDKVYLGYPIWFGEAPKILSSFMERYDFTNKTIIPFCTSGGSGIGSSADTVRHLAPNATWLEGHHFDRDVASSVVTDWADSLFQQITTPDQEEESAMPKLSIQVGNSVFTATLEDNDTTRAFLTRLPMSVTMGELNGNEKFYYLPNGLPTNSRQVGTIQNGDLMLYGSDCLVLFYKTFSSGYSYTRLGNVEDPSGLAAALGEGSVEVRFQVR